MKEKEVIRRLLNQFIYKDNDVRRCIDFCNNCDSIIKQIDLGDDSYGCEYCHSKNISIIEVE